MIGEKIKECRLRKGMTQGDVAAFLNIDRSTYTKYETNNSEPSFATLRKITNLFEVDYKYLLSEKE